MCVSTLVCPILNRPFSPVYRKVLGDMKLTSSSLDLLPAIDVRVAHTQDMLEVLRLELNRHACRGEATCCDHRAKKRCKAHLLVI